MKIVLGQPAARPPGSDEIAELRARLAEANETLRAIRAGEVDTVVIAGKQGPRVFTLEGAEHAYRVLIESMNEGALTLTADKTILYANQSFARMVKCPLEQVMGSSFRRFISADDRVTLRLLLKQADKSGSKTQMMLKAGDGSQMPAQISIRPLAKNDFNGATIGMVLTDMTEARRTEELLRALTHRVVQVQEAERAGLALELHDSITQPLCAVVFRSQALVASLSADAGPAKGEANQLRELLGQTAEEVERISRNLRPGLLEHLGLISVLRTTSTEFAKRTGVAVKLDCAELAEPLPPEIELALYRIFQEALKNIEKHARARQLTVQLTREGDVVQLVIKDDGIGFDADHHAARREKGHVLGLLGMRERAAYVGGTLKIESGRRAGTEIEVRIPLPPVAPRP